MFHHLAIFNAKNIHLRIILIRRVVLPMGFAQGGHKVAAAHAQDNALVGQGRMGLRGQFLKVFESVRHVLVVLNVTILGNVLLQRGGIATLHQGILQQVADQLLVFGRLVQIRNLAGSIDVGMTAGVAFVEGRNHIPMFNHLVIGVKIKKVGRDPLGLTLVDILKDVTKSLLFGLVVPGPLDLNVAVGAAFEKGQEKFQKALLTVLDARRMLLVHVARVLVNGLLGVTVANAFHVQVQAGLQAGMRFGCVFVVVVGGHGDRVVLLFVCLWSIFLSEIFCEIQ
mmetsp:Transcript_116/g.248  ORF Transcript_116/g.248 Transcript_116/m.248 type:complete len:282 (+) Transcript_116:88-933(+)